MRLAAFNLVKAKYRAIDVAMELPAHRFNLLDHLRFNLLTFFTKMSFTMIVRTESNDIRYSIAAVFCESDDVVSFQISTPVRFHEPKSTAEFALALGA